MSVPELFHHQRRFIGALVIDRASPRAETARTTEIRLLCQGLTLAQGGAERCPALADDGKCSIQDDRKPAMCRAVPLDPLLPDAEQGELLARRASGPEALPSNCLRGGSPDHDTLLTEKGGVVDQAAAQALADRRREVAEDRRWWGNAVLQLLSRELFSGPAGGAAIRPGAFLVVALDPVLAAVSSLSPRCRDRCLEYLDAQLALIFYTLKTRFGLPEGPESLEQAKLRAFARRLSALRRGLLEGGVRVSGADENEAAERWLGV